MKYVVKNNDQDEYVEKVELIHAKTRNHLALGIFYVWIVFLFSSSIYGLYIGNFSYLSVVFNYSQTPIELLLGYFFLKT